MSFTATFAKGKGFRSSPLCVPIDASSEDDKEVERILSKSQPSRKRSAHEDLKEEGDTRTENEKRRETHPAEPMNVIGKLFVIFTIIISTSNLEVHTAVFS